MTLNNPTAGRDINLQNLSDLNLTLNVTQGYISDGVAALPI